MVAVKRILPNLRRHELDDFRVLTEFYPEVYPGFWCMKDDIVRCSSRFFLDRNLDRSVHVHEIISLGLKK